jgi:hypothetical protein
MTGFSMVDGYQDPFRDWQPVGPCEDSPHIRTSQILSVQNSKLFPLLLPPPLPLDFSDLFMSDHSMIDDASKVEAGPVPKVATPKEERCRRCERKDIEGCQHLDAEEKRKKCEGCSKAAVACSFYGKFEILEVGSGADSWAVQSTRRAPRKRVKEASEEEEKTVDRKVRASRPRKVKDKSFNIEDVDLDTPPKEEEEFRWVTKEGVALR